jgi:hypothetical protein
MSEDELGGRLVSPLGFHQAGRGALLAKVSAISPWVGQSAWTTCSQHWSMALTSDVLPTPSGPGQPGHQPGAPTMHPPRPPATRIFSAPIRFPISVKARGAGIAMTGMMSCWFTVSLARVTLAFRRPSPGGPWDNSDGTSDRDSEQLALEPWVDSPRDREQDAGEFPFHAHPCFPPDARGRGPSSASSIGPMSSSSTRRYVVRAVPDRLGPKNNDSARVSVALVAPERGRIIQHDLAVNCGR